MLDSIRNRRLRLLLRECHSGFDEDNQEENFPLWSNSSRYKAHHLLDEAAIYNSPYHDLKYEKFGEVAQEAARFLAKKALLPFTKIYLLNALSPGPEAFEVWPTLAKCE